CGETRGSGEVAPVSHVDDAAGGPLGDVEVAGHALSNGSSGEQEQRERCGGAGAFHGGPLRFGALRQEGPEGGPRGTAPRPSRTRSAPPQPRPGGASGRSPGSRPR